MAKQKRRGWGFHNIDLGEIQELTDTIREELTDDFTEMSTSEPDPGEEEEDTEEAVARKQIDTEQSGRRVLIIQGCFWLILWSGPSRIWVLKLKQIVEEGLVPYRNIFRKMKKIRQKLQHVSMKLPQMCQVLLPPPPPPPPLPPLRQQDWPLLLLSLTDVKTMEMKISMMIYFHLMNSK